MKELDSLIQQEKDRIKNGQPAMYTKDQMDQYQKRYESLSEMVNAQESAGWKVTWNPMSIYILSFVEKNYKVTIDGVARTNADVAEFLNRLQDGIFFISPEPGNLLIKTDKATKTEMINFKFTSMVNYSAGKKG
jgi:Tfp pilus assembly protein PilN